jgi:hypothetical protein
MFFDWMCTSAILTLFMVVVYKFKQAKNMQKLIITCIFLAFRNLKLE